MSHRDDVLDLEREFAAAMQRMYTVGNGLARLRADLERETVAPTATPAAPSVQPLTGARPAPSAPQVPAPSATGPAAPPPPSPLPASHPREPWYRREGAVTRVLAVAGAVVTLWGVALLLVIAVRHGWFGPQARVAAGALLAVVLGTLGVRGGSRDRSRGGPVGSAPVALVATGAAAAYLDVVAVTTLYSWVAPSVGLALCVGVALLGCHLARRWASELLAVLMVAGAAVFSPVVAGEPGWLLSAVLAVLAVVGWWASGGRRTPRLTVVRTLPVALSLLVGAVAADTPRERAALLAVALVVLAAALATAVADTRRHPRDVTPSVAVGLGVVGALVVGSVLDDPARWMAAGLVAVVLLLAATTFARVPVGPLPTHLVTTTASGGALAAVLAVVSGTPRAFLATGLLLLAVGHVAVAGTTRSRLSLAVAAFVTAVAGLAWLDHPVAMLTPALAEAHDLPVAFVDSGLAGALAALAAWATGTVRGVPDLVRRWVRVAAVGTGLVAAATMLVSVGTLGGASFGDPRLGFTTGHALATVAWMTTAAALLLHSLAHRSDLALRFGLALVAVAVAKLFLFDLASLDGIVRSVAFIVTGLVLLATGSRYARAWERGRAST